jgi:hypothetical protein
MAQKVNAVIAFLNGANPSMFRIVAEDVDAVPNQMLFVDTSTGPVTVTLPDPTFGATVSIVDHQATAASNPITIVSDEPIDRAPSPMVISQNGQVVKLVYSGLAVGWLVI